jgi:hypothetical protein
MTSLAQIPHLRHDRGATKAEVEARREALLDIIDAGKPMTVRQVFYQATVHGPSRKRNPATPKCRRT